MRLRLAILSLLLLSSLPIFSQRWQETDTLKELTREQADSLFFRFSHHYTINFNFCLKTDSMVLIPHESDFIDTCVVFQDEILVVADIRQMDSDTIWVKLYRDQMTMGWVSEQELLKSAIPDDIISEIIFFFEVNQWLLYLLLTILLAIGVMMFKINRLYSVLYILTTLGLAYSIWNVIYNDYDFWQEFFYHPTLDPFILPDEMKLVVGLFWLECITSIALIFVVSDHFSRQNTSFVK